MPYRVDCNESDDDDMPDWRTEFRGTLEECKEKAEEFKRPIYRYSEVMVVDEETGVPV